MADDKPQDGGDGNTGDGNTGDKPAGDGGSAELARMRQALAKANAEAKKSREEADALKASIADGKSDAERVAGQLTELKARADAADLRAMRAEVAASKGLTAAQAKRLQGTTVEELEADADELLAAFKPADDAGAGAATGAASAGAGNGRPAGAGRPREALRPGATPPSGAEPEQLDLSKVPF